MKVLTVCGAGVGCSLLLRILAEEAFDELGIPVEIEATDVGSAKGLRTDLVITLDPLVGILSELDAPILSVRNIMDKESLKEKIRDFVNDM